MAFADDRPPSDWLAGGRAASPNSGFEPEFLRAPAFKLTAAPWKALLILVDFPDRPRKGTPAYFKEMLFGTNGATPSGGDPYPFETMAELYFRMSGGALTFGNVTVVGWVTAPEPVTYYARYDGTSAFAGCYGLGTNLGGEGAAQLLTFALGKAVEAGVTLADFENVDNGLSGNPDGVFVVHAGPGGEQTSENSRCIPGSYGGDLWSHENAVTYGTQSVSYVMGPAESASAQSATGLATAGVWAHEFGHMLNLPDLYAPISEPGFGVGCWDLMGYGIHSCWDSGYIGDEPGNDPQEMSVWSRAQLAWAAPREVTDNACNRRVDPVEYGGETFKVTPDAARPKDYFLIEYRAAAGRDADLLPAAFTGNRNRVCIWHIDEQLIGEHAASMPRRLPNDIACQPNQDRAACLTEHYGVSLVEPDGNYSLEKGNAYAETGDCLGPDAEMTSAPSDKMGTNYDLWPWSAKPASHWTVRTGALEEQAAITVLVNDPVQNVPPEIQGTPPDAEPGKLWRYQPKIAAAAGLPVWSLKRFPTGMTIDAETGLIAWRVPSSFSADTVPVELRVENCGGTDAQKLNILVAGGERAGRCGCSSRSGMTPLDALPFAMLLAVWIGIRLRKAGGSRPAL